jgi:nicotinamide riboside transporter PnuC
MSKILQWIIGIILIELIFTILFHVSLIGIVCHVVFLIMFAIIAYVAWETHKGIKKKD